MTQTVIPEAAAAAHRADPAVAPAESLPSPPRPDENPARVTLRARLSHLVGFHAAVSASDLLFPEPTRNRRNY